MRILYICLCGYYSEGWGYQDNLLAEQNIKDNHEVFVITTQYKRTFGNKIEKVSLGSYTDEMGVNITRIPFKYEWLGSLKDKIRKYKYLYQNIEQVKPDIIFVHGLQFVDLNIIQEYKRKHPNVKIYGDNHATRHNSGKTFLSNKLLHSKFYKYIINKNKNLFEKIFYITPDSKVFMNEMYKLDTNLEFLPLCGRIYTEKQIHLLREFIYRQENLDDDKLLFLHTGKMNSNKKTLEVLNAFKKMKKNNAELFLIGSFSEDIQSEAMQIIESSHNIRYLGWKDTRELEKYLCAADVLLQPGSQSIIFQQGISCGCALVLEKNVNTQFLINDNGILINEQDDLSKIIELLINDKSLIERFKKNSIKFSYSTLNYSVQSKKFLGD